MVTGPVRRSDIDACPGALRLHAAADGPLARIRLPGGLITGDQLRVMGALAGRYGDGHVELTSRANLQLRALTGSPVDALAGELAATGLLPSPTHERVRNIAASPASAARLRPLVQRLDQALCADAELVDLPGRFLFAIDDGSGDVARSADVAAVPTAASSTDVAAAAASSSPAAPAILGNAASPAVAQSAVLFAGVDAGLRVTQDHVVPALLAAAHAFLAERDTAPAPVWRVRELPDGPRRLAARVAAMLGIPLHPPAPRFREPVRRELVGVLPGGDTVGALVPLGRLGPAAVAALSEADLVVVTPWRGVLVPELPVGEANAWARRLAGAGLEVAPDSPWSGVTTCAGRPGCTNALADVRSDATATLTRATGPVPVHWVGCARGCGSPSGPHVRVEATADGYDVTGARVTGHASAAEVGALVAAARRN